MQGYLLEVLFPTGWRRSGNILWRFAEAEVAARAAIAEDEARAVRVLPVRVFRTSVLELTGEHAGEPA
jgi:hypothetical protein